MASIEPVPAGADAPAPLPGSAATTSDPPRALSDDDAAALAEAVRALREAGIEVHGIAVIADATARDG